MANKFVPAILALVAIVATAAAAELPDQAEARIQIVQDIEAFKAANPSVLLTPLAVTRNNARQQFTYTLGNRLAGDRLVAVNQDSAAWSTLQDVSLTLSYPVAGAGAVINYVQIDVQQSSNVGRGYVAAGGIGQRFIQIIVEATSTSYFSYTSQIYGR